MKPSFEDIPSELESYHSIKRFIDKFDQLESISLSLGDNYRTHLNNNWKNAIDKFKSNQEIAYPWQELIMILSYDYYLGPYIGLPESEKIKFYTKILDHLRVEL